MNQVVSNYSTAPSQPALAPTREVSTREGEANAGTGSFTGTQEQRDQIVAQQQTSTTSTGTTGECLLSRPAPTETNQNTCWSQCQQAQRDKELECETLFKDIENALAARGCPARVVPTGAPGSNPCDTMMQQQSSYYNTSSYYGNGYNGGYSGGGCSNGTCNLR